MTCRLRHARPDDICYYPRSNKIGFRGVGVLGDREPDYGDGERDHYVGPSLRRWVSFDLVENRHAFAMARLLPTASDTAHRPEQSRALSWRRRSGGVRLAATLSCGARHRVTAAAVAERAGGRGGGS